MSDNNTISAELLTVINFSERRPYAEKVSNNNAWGKKRIEAIDVQYPDTFDPEYIERVEDNYLLMNGMPMVNYTKGAYGESIMDIQSLRSEGLDVPNTLIPHFDFVGPYLDILWGDKKRQRLRYTVTDSSLFTQNYIKEHKKGLLKSHFETKLIAPIKQYALLKWMAENGVNDLFALDLEQRKQMDADLARSVESLIPRDISNFMKTGAMGGIEMQAQALADALVATLDIKYRVDEAYRHTFATDGLVFETGVRNIRPYFEWVDLTSFNTGGGSDVFINNNPWFKRVRSMHPVDIWNTFAQDFNKEDVRLFDNLVRARGTASDSTDKSDQIALRIDYTGKELLSNTNLLTEEGQQRYTGFLQKYQGGDISNYQNIRVSTVTWASYAKLKKIYRADEGVLTEHYFTEDYEFNPLKGDLKEEVEWVKQYWRGTRIGEGDSQIFTEIGPVPFQYRDISNPRDCRSPYVGGFLNDMNGKGYRRSPLDKIKPFIHAANLQMKSIQEREATDIGKVVLMTVAAKPRGWTWGKLLQVIRTTKMLPIDTRQSGLTAADVQFFRSVDMSSLYDILPRINHLQYLAQRMGEGLAVNSARLGSQAASTSVGNNRANLNQSFSQTHPRAAWVDKITEMLLENLIYLGKMSVKNGNIFLRYALDDLSIANIDIDVDDLDDALLGVKVSTDELDVEQLNIPKNILLPYIQNNNLGFGLVMETLYATTRGEFMHIASKAEIEAQIKQAEAMNFAKLSEEEKAQKAMEAEAALLELKSNLKRMEDAQNNEAKKDMAALQSMTIANGNDINRNQENDYLESAELDRQQKREEVLIKDTLERDKLALEDKWNTEELAVLKQKVEKMGEVAKKKAAAKKK